METKLKETNYIKTDKALIILMIIDIIIMIPCFITTICGEYLGGNLGNIIVNLEIVPLLIFVFIQCFYLPEIIFILIVLLGIERLTKQIKHKLKYKKFLIIYIVCIIINIISFFSVSEIFWGLMSV